jgi:hypothetical protein
MIAEGLPAGATAAARMSSMLSEEALIVLAAFGACGLLVLGVLELIWPTRSRHAMRRAPAAPLARRAPYARRLPPLVPSPVPLAPLPAALVSPTATALAPPELPPPAESVPAPPLEMTAPPLEEPSVLAEVSAVATCLALYREQHYREVVERGTQALAAGSDGEPPSDLQEAAALSSVVALARQALGEDAAARAALEWAIAAVPQADRPTYERQLASLAASVAQGLLAEAGRHARPDSEDCLSAIRSAVAWLVRGVAAAPADPALVELTADAQALLWPAWERTIVALAQRQDFRAARRLLREAMADPAFPPARAETFRALFSGTFSGEIGQLTAQAIRSMQAARESDALAALERAETLLDTLSDEALTPSRRDEVDRRLWWGYNRLGARRVDARDHEAALEPLLHALGYDVGPDRRQETVALLVRALDGIVDGRAPAIRELADARDREAALVQCDRLWTLVRSAAGTGVAPAELAATSGKVQRLFESLGAPQR